MRIDLNADAGESFGPWPMGRDAELFEVVTSVNLACGFHAGDPVTMRRSVALAKAKGVAVGAHPSFPDLVGFGRREMALSPEELYADTLYQLGALAAFVKAEGLALHHVKAHGALYLRMARDGASAKAVAQAVRDFDVALPLVVLGGTVMAQAARDVGVPVVLEAFPDRGYLASGQLAPRSMPGALVREPDIAARRAVTMVLEHRVEALDGSSVTIDAQTLCIHGDNPEAPEIARAVRRALEAEGVTVCPF